MEHSFSIRELLNAESSAHITNHGAHLLEWAPQGNIPVIWRPRTITLAEHTAIRGGIPIITPWFGHGFQSGNNADYEPFHSFARLTNWQEIKEITNPDTHAAYTLDSTSLPQETLRRALAKTDEHQHEVTFELRYDIESTNELTLQLQFINTSACDLTVEMGFHTYFRVMDVANICVYGLEHSDFIDAANGITCSPSEQPITPEGPLDRIYSNPNDIIIQDRNFGRNIIMHPTDASRIIVWNPWTNGDTFSDMEAGEWRHFICIEACICKEGQAIVPPGETLELSQTIQCESII